MAIISRNTLGISVLFLLLTLAPMAQAQDLPQDLTSISPAEALALNTGRLYRFSSWPNNPPLPPGILLTDPAIGEDGSGLATNVFYSASLAAVFWDDRESLAEQMLIEAAANGNHQMFQQEQQGEELGAQGPYGTNDFWLEPVSVGSNLFNAFLHSTTNGSTYLITSTEAIDPVTNSVWQVEGSLQGGTNDATPFALGIALRTNNLFIAAQACDECATNTLPLWWQLAYFGVTGVDPNGDYDCDGVSNLLEFLNSTDPNKIVFSLSVTNEYVPTTAVPVQVNIASGVPSYLAVLLNDDSPGNATWQPFTSTSLSVALPTNGTYVITVGLRGLATNATQSWQSLTVFQDTTPLTLAITNLPALSGSRPLIDPAGYTTRALSALTWTVVDANGDTNAGTGMVVDQGWSLSDSYHVTNWFQCVDLPLALGTNWISIQAVDWAGTAAVTNFTYVFDTGGDTTAPALTLTWPQDGTQVSGDSFTVQAWMDDDTAAVALQYTDGDAILQTITGLVERGGNVWVHGVPLAPGTNSFSLLAVDAAGNVSTNNFTVVQSSVELVICELSQDDMTKAYATVWGEIDDPDYTITVNGVDGTNYGNGSWQVDNVPLPLGGPIVLQATAQLDAQSRPSQNRELPAAAQSGGAATVETLLKQQPEPIVFTHKYGYKLDYTLSPSTNTFEGHHFELQWARGVGGTNTEASWTVDPDGNVSSNLFIAVWPPDNGFVPTLDSTTWYGSYSNGVPTGSITWTADPPSVQWMEQSTSVGSWPNYYQASWSESSARDVRLYTGGSATRKKQGLFNLSASLTYQSVLDTNRLGDWDVLYWPSAFIPFLSPASPPVGVPSQQIALGAVGKLGSDGHRWVARSDGREIIITPKAPGTSYAGQLPSAQKYTPYISANGTDLRTTAPVFCVGQHLTFQLAFEPTLTFVDHVSHWKLPDKFVNEPWQTLYSGPEGSYPLGSVNYRVNANLLTNLATSCWYVNGPSGLVSIGTNIRFSNGQLASLAANGTFSIYRPSFSNFLATANGFTWNSPWLEGAMAFNVNLNSTNSGYFGITQLIYGTGLYYGTAGEFWLDGNSEIYGEPGSNGPKWYDPGDAATHGVSLIDGPSAPAAPCVDMNATFKDYLRFMPAGASNIFVTIATNGWFMDGSACLIGGMTRSNLPPAVAPANTDEFPQWVHHMPE